MFSKSKTSSSNLSNNVVSLTDTQEPASVESPKMSTPPNPAAANPAPTQRNSMIDMITTPSATGKPSILSEGFSFRGEIIAKGAIHVEGALNGQIQVDELTIGARGQVEGVVTCTSLHIKGKFSGTATCNELIVTSSATVDGHVVYQTLSVQKGASIKGDLLLVN